MISWCWPEIRVLAVGGKHISKKGLLEIGNNNVFHLVVDVSGFFVCLIIMNILQSFASISANPYTYMDNTVRYYFSFLMGQLGWYSILRENTPYWLLYLLEYVSLTYEIHQIPIYRFNPSSVSEPLCTDQF